jgi:hypothetical protein
MRDMTTSPAPAPARRSAYLIVALLIGAAVAVALAVLGRVHTATRKPLWLGPFPSLITMKVWLTVAVLGLVVIQLISALWMYGKLGVKAPSWIGGAHRASGALAVLVSLPVAANCLWALGLESTSGRVLAHALLGCAFYGAFVAKVLVLHGKRLPNWALPVVAGLLFAAIVGVGLTSAIWWLTTQGIPR